MVRILVSFFALLLLCCGVAPVFATEVAGVAPVELTRSFTLVRGGSLWKDWLSQGGRKNIEWKEYKATSCVLSRISCTEEAWRHLPIGQVITTFRPQKDIDADKQKQIRALAQRAEIAEQHATQLEAQVAKLKADAQQTKRNTQLLLGSLGLCILVYLLLRLLKGTADDLNAIKKEEQIVGLQDIPLATDVPPQTVSSQAVHTDFVSAFPRPTGDTAIAKSRVQPDDELLMFDIPESAFVEQTPTRTSEKSKSTLVDGVSSLHDTSSVEKDKVQFPFPTGQGSSEDKPS